MVLFGIFVTLDRVKASVFTSTLRRVVSAASIMLLLHQLFSLAIGSYLCVLL